LNTKTGLIEKENSDLVSNGDMLRKIYSWFKVMGQEIDLSFITNRTVVTYANMLKNPDEETIMRRNMSLELTSASLRSFLLRVMVFNPFKRPNSIDLLDDQIFKAVRNPA
jgi:serine/threonine protein kinase